MMLRIYIVGMPGAGKTHFGRLLSKGLNMQFKDIDELIEKQTGMSVKQLVDEKGESHFRELEHEVLMKTSLFNRIVISCGGGTPVYYNNMEWMKKNGIVVFLDTDLKQISSRIQQNITRRPMFLGLSGDEIDRKLKELYDLRKKFYLKSEIVIDKQSQRGASLSPVIQRIMKICKSRCH
jgi:shikimate kinase